jgi:hypothetical protein
MKKVFALILASSFFLAGCFDNTEEITLNADGTGTVTNTSDMSSVIALSKQMGSGNEELDKMMGDKMEKTIDLSTKADSIPDITQDEKDLLKKGTMFVKMDGKANEFYTKLTFPFNNPEQIATYSKITGKVFGAMLKDQMANSPMGGGMGGADVPAVSSFNDYYKLSYEKGELKKSLNKEKYATLAEDAYLKAMKEAAGMGIPVTATYIINLPSPATKVEGKNAKLSDDKLKVTVKVSIDDFYDNPESLEFKIKY